MLTSVGPARFADNRVTAIQDNAIILNWSGEETSTGPDIGFIRLPNEVKNWALENRAFYSYANRFRLYTAGSRPSSTRAFYILGAYDEGSKIEAHADGFNQVTTNFGMLLGDIDTSDKSLDAVGSMSFKPRFSPDLPTTFNGLSGSGVWAVNANEDALRHILIGVVYYQGPRDEKGNRILVFHSVQWIYEWLIAQVARRFPDEFESFT